MSIDSEQGTQDNYKDAVKDGKSGVVSLWLDALALSSKEEEGWRKQGQNVTDLYRQAGNKENSDHKKKFNILHSNVETMCPALYNSTPIPDVRRRFNDADPTGKAVADILERCLSYSVDSYDFDHVMSMVVKDAELPGRAVARVRYKPYVSADGNSLDYQEVTCEHTSWKHFRRGPGQEWADVPWIAFELFLGREELIQLSPKLGGSIKLDVTTQVDDKRDGRNVPEVFKRARVWEIWDKDRRKVIFIAESMKDQPLREDDDPLGLTDFFPIPRPIYSIETSDSLVPVVPYEVYRAQAEELERVSERIIVLTEAIKARAIYDGRLTEMDRLSTAEDADNISLENVAVLADGSKLNDHIWFYPIDVVVAAQEKLIQTREQIKQTIYEITGISDILRGASEASETATAQNIKQKWGSLRIQGKQAEIQRFARDLFRIKSELFATKFEPQVLSMMTGIQITPDVMQLLRSDRMRGYRVDIESDSTIRADLTRNQQNMTMFLQGTAQFAQGMGPIAMQFPQMMTTIITVFSAFARNFKLGKQADDALDNLSQQAQQFANQPKPPDPAIAAEQAKLQQDDQHNKMQLAQDAQQHQQKMDQESQQFQMKLEFEKQKHANEIALKSGEAQADDAINLHEINTNAHLQHQQQVTDAHLEHQKQTTDAHLTQQKQQADTQVKHAQIAAKPAPAGKSKPAPRAAPAADLSGVMNALMKAATAMEHLAEVQSADSEVVRHPDTGKIMGARKKLNRPTLQ